MIGDVIKNRTGSQMMLNDARVLHLVICYDISHDLTIGVCKNCLLHFQHV